MSAAALEVLAAFDTLPDEDRDAVVEALLVRYPAGAGGLLADGLLEVANEVFLMFDAAEADDATHPG